METATVCSYLPQERQEAGDRLLQEAEEELARCRQAWDSRVPGQDDHYLRDRLDGARVGVRQRAQYIRIGCPRVPGTP